MNQNSVAFYEDEIISVKDEKTGKVYVPLKQIVDNLGLEWSGQAAKIKNNNNKWKCVSIKISTVKGDQKAVCIPLTKINGWLFSINANKVRPDLKEKIERYQEQCFQVLYEYWNPKTDPNKKFDDFFGDSPAIVSKKFGELIIAYSEARAKIEEQKKTLDYLLGGKDKELVSVILEKLKPTQEGKEFKEHYLYEYLRRENEALKNKNLIYAHKCGIDKPFDRVEAMLANARGVAEIVLVLNKYGWNTGRFVSELNKKGFKLEDLGKLTNTPVLIPFKAPKRIALREDKQEDGDNNFLQQLTRAV